MTDLRGTIVPKSDQLNADELLGTTKTIIVTKVSLSSEADQPVVLNYENDNGRPYKPCKSMRRVLINVWGADGNAFVGRSMTLYCDPKVQFGGMAVGGIRISHMSHIKKSVTMALTATRANKKPFTVEPLIEVDPLPTINVEHLTDDAQLAAKGGVIAYQTFWKALTKPEREILLPKHGDLKSIAQAADDEAARLLAEKEAEETEGDLDAPFGSPALKGGVQHVGNDEVGEAA